MTNPFDTRTASLSGPGRDYLPVTPDDASDLSSTAIALYAETAGDICFDTVSGSTRTVAVPDFGWVLCGASRVRATGTTALGIHAVTL